jgi:UPF0716 protein FxsA
VMFIVVPLVELYVIVQVAGALGIVPTLLLLLAVSLAGSWLVRREGLGIVGRARQVLSRGELPTVEIVNGMLVLLAGALLLTPGFVTDVVGLLLLIPFTRAAVRGVVRRRFESWMRLPFVSGFSGGVGRRVNVGRAVIVTDATTVAGNHNGARDGRGPARGPGQGHGQGHGQGPDQGLAPGSLGVGPPTGEGG